MKTCGEFDPASVDALLETFGIEVERVADDQPIPGTYWGEPEAGLIENRVCIRNDTPAHSLLHEACHYICMDPGRRKGLHTDAGGGYAEENGVCYLQILLADFFPGYSRDACMADMDEWGYTFRLGSARAWFESDAEDARAWLEERGIIDASGQPERLNGTRV